MIVREVNGFHLLIDDWKQAYAHVALFLQKQKQSAHNLKIGNAHE